MTTNRHAPEHPSCWRRRCHAQTPHPARCDSGDRPVALGRLRHDGRVSLPKADPHRQPGRPVGRAGDPRLHRQPPLRRLRVTGRVAVTIREVLRLERAGSLEHWVTAHTENDLHLPDARRGNPKAPTCPRHLNTLDPWSRDPRTVHRRSLGTRATTDPTEPGSPRQPKDQPRRHNGTRTNRGASPSLPTQNLNHCRISSLRRQKRASGTTNARQPEDWVGQTIDLRTPPGCGSTPSAS